MSVSILYSRLFNLAINHNYYEDGLARNIHLKPTEETVKLLRGGRMLFKEIPKGITVLYRTLEDEISPFVNIGPNARLVFSLNNDNLPEFLNITNLDESVSRKYKSGNILYFRNNPNAGPADPNPPSNDPDSPEALAYEIIDFLRGSLFTYEFTLASSEDVLMTVSNENNIPVSVVDETVSEGDDGIYRQQIDLRNHPKGKYTITIRKSSNNALISSITFYSDDKLVGKKILGILDIEFNAVNNYIYNNTWEYAIRLERKSTVWKYLIVDKTKQMADLANYSLSISDTRSDLENPYPAKFTFTRFGNQPHDLIKINGMDTIVFKSDAASLIPFFENPLLAITLSKIPNDPGDPEVTIIKNLPNPKHNGLVKNEAEILESEIFVFI